MVFILCPTEKKENLAPVVKCQGSQPDNLQLVQL